MSEFIHLHVHSDYSLGDGMMHVNDILEKAKQFKMPAIALTVHGNLFGAMCTRRAIGVSGV